MPRPRSSPDGDLWRRVVRDVAPLRERAAPPPASPPRPREPQAAPPQCRPAPSSVRQMPVLEPGRFAGIDRANAERLKRGRHPIEARLDLHGMTQAEAHRALGAFVAGARHAGKRCVLVVTGRSGVLRNAVPRWLAEADLRPHLLAIAAAQPRDGGAGALYVMLRRTKAG